MYLGGGVNAAGQRDRNRSLLLQSLLLRGSSSRQGLATATGLTPATISRISDELIRQEVIRVEDSAAAQPGARGVGRPSAQLGINPRGLFVGTVYLAGDVADLGVHDARGRVVDRIRVAVDAPHDADGTLVAVAGELRRLVDRAGATDRLSGVGATVLGGVDEHGVVVVAHPGWHDVPAAEILNRELNVPIVVGRMQHGLVTAEAWLGAGAGIASVTVLDVSDGIGVATAVDGRVVTGFDHREGQLGHFVVPGIERVCTLCGLPGCLQTQLRDAAFAAEARRVLDGEPVADHDIATPEDHAIIERLYAAARDGDLAAQRSVETRARYIGYALALVTAVIDPEMFVVSGPTMLSGWDLIAPVITAERARRSPLPHEERHSRVTLTSFGADAVLIGTAALALRQIYLPTEPSRQG